MGQSNRIRVPVDVDSISKRPPIARARRVMFSSPFPPFEPGEAPNPRPSSVSSIRAMVEPPGIEPFPLASCASAVTRSPVEADG